MELELGGVELEPDEPMAVELNLGALWGRNDYLLAAASVLSGRAGDVGGLVDQWRLRDELIERYSFAIPNERALRAIAKLQPIVELGAGNGYWASLLRQGGVEVTAFDVDPKADPFTEVEVGDASVLADFSDRTLLLCWPPLQNPMALDALCGYAGQRFVYIGEDVGGCCADDSFFAELETNWRLKQSVVIPAWSMIHDFMSIFSRK